MFPKGQSIVATAGLRLKTRFTPEILPAVLNIEPDLNKTR
jgi:hypothetical protein